MSKKVEYTTQHNYKNGWIDLEVYGDEKTAHKNKAWWAKRHPVNQFRIIKRTTKDEVIE